MTNISFYYKISNNELEDIRSLDKYRNTGRVSDDGRKTNIKLIIIFRLFYSLTVQFYHDNDIIAVYTKFVIINNSFIFNSKNTSYNLT